MHIRLLQVHRMKISEYNKLRIIEEWKYQVAANDMTIPENFQPTIESGTKYDQEYDEVTGLNVSVRMYKRGKYSVGGILC